MFTTEAVRTQSGVQGMDNESANLTFPFEYYKWLQCQTSGIQYAQLLPVTLRFLSNNSFTRKFENILITKLVALQLEYL